MCIKNRLLSLIFRILFLFICGLGLYLNSGIPNGTIDTYMLVFYTIQSNALCFIFFALLTFKNISDLKRKGIHGTTRFYPHFKGAVTMSIAITFIIYHFVIMPEFVSVVSNYDPFILDNLTVHYFVPLLAILDWLLFDIKLSFRWFDPILWLLLPISYLIFILTRAQLGGIIAVVKSYYPYFFVDVNLIGWTNMLLNVGGMLLGFLALGYIIYLIDKVSVEKIKVRRGMRKQQGI